MTAAKYEVVISMSRLAPTVRHQTSDVWSSDVYYSYEIRLEVEENGATFQIPFQIKKTRGKFYFLYLFLIKNIINNGKDALYVSPPPMVRTAALDGGAAPL